MKEFLKVFLFLLVPMLVIIGARGFEWGAIRFISWLERRRQRRKPLPPRVEGEVHVSVSDEVSNRVWHVGGFEKVRGRSKSC